MNSIEKLKLIHARFKRQIMDMQGVNGFGIGLKFIDNEMTDTTCFVIFVDEKVKLEELKNKDLIPKTIEGVITDVIEFKINFDSDESNRNKISSDPNPTPAPIPPTPPPAMFYNPLMGGCEVGAEASGTSGTMGVLVTLAGQPGKVFGLSCWHVLCQGVDLSADPEVLQPSSVHNGGYIGKIVGNGFIDAYTDPTSHLVTGIDAALVELSERSNFPRIIGLEESIVGTADPVLGSQVRKFGSVTGLTNGIITTLHITTQSAKPPLELENQIEITTSDPAIPFGIMGDSGSAIVDQNSNIVALLVSGRDSGTKVYATPIKPIEKALGINVIPTGNNIELLEAVATIGPGDTPPVGFTRTNIDLNLSGSGGPVYYYYKLVELLPTNPPADMTIRPITNYFVSSSNSTAPGSSPPDFQRVDGGNINDGHGATIYLYTRPATLYDPPVFGTQFEFTNTPSSLNIAPTYYNVGWDLKQLNGSKYEFMSLKWPDQPITQIIIIPTHSTNLEILSVNSFTRVPYDTNRDQGGSFDYMFISKVINPIYPPITDIAIYYPNESIPTDYTQVPGNLNLGTGGKEVRFAYKTGGTTPPISDLFVIYSDDSKALPPANFYIIRKDLDIGDGGVYAFLCFRRVGGVKI